MFRTGRVRWLSGLGLTIVSLLIMTVYASPSLEAATITDIKPGVPVSLKIPDTELLVSGCAPPNSLVTITDASSVVGTVVTDNSGKFSRLLTSQTPTIHTIGTYFEDQNSRLSKATSNLVALTAKTLTYLDAYPSPTVVHQPASINSGQNITFQGYTCPNATVKLVIDGNITLTTVSNTNGFWSVTVNSINFNPGVHTYIVSAAGAGFSTINSNKFDFTVSSSPPDTTSNNQTPSEADLSIPVVIESPEDGYRTNVRDVTVSGSGPPNAQIEVFADGVLVGSVFSNAFGEWSLQLAVLGTQQSLEARACNSTGCGDISNSVRVYYGLAADASQAGECDLKIYLSKYRYSNLPVTKGIDIDVRIDGGKPNERYDLNIDWGDVVIDNQTLDGKGIRLHHTYGSIGNFNGRVAIQEVNSKCKDIVYFSVQVIAQKNKNNWLWYLLLLPVIFYLLLKTIKFNSQ